MNNPDQGSRLLGFQLDAECTTAALGEFLTALILASQTLETDRRQGWLDALEAVHRLLSRLVDPYDKARTKVPFVTLMAALQDLDLGTVHPGLVAHRPKGGQLSGYDQVVIRALAAAAMDMLYKLSRKKPDAARRVARAFDKLGAPMGNSQNASIEEAGRTVAKWRDRLEEGSDQDRAVECYKSFKEILRFPPGTSAAAIEAGLPKLLSEVLPGRINKINVAANPMEGTGALHDSPDALVMGAVVDGHRYIGGDPDEESSWEVVR
jgi:hypothetical protein